MPRVMLVLKLSRKAHSTLRPTVLQEYETLCEKLKEMSTLGGISGLLGWGGHHIHVFPSLRNTPTICVLCA